jgi:spore cortex formation protein SpoVR/YcgB (stage V sporulation)
VELGEKDRALVLDHVQQLWGHRVRLEGVDQNSGAEVYVTIADDVAAAP